MSKVQNTMENLPVNPNISDLERLNEFFNARVYCHVFLSHAKTYCSFRVLLQGYLVLVLLL